MSHKICGYCNENKPYTDFNSNRNRSDRLDHRCKTCVKQQNIQRTQRVAFMNKNNRLETIYINQNKQCPICNNHMNRSPKEGQPYLVIDHCHNTGDIRGIICNKCNGALGILGDSLNVIENAFNYLKQPTMKIESEDE